ncbi:hypothetical protein EUGRSUZ_E01228 [Eucalyptus grandis]|uniref:Uncharacterized protein n=2 Tax=Eucalyptus grandis TaxID=71139 RepID=A0ACC3KUN0_EUCGR|nr:hypothetical protein EUGRSUZ_E01228 [Eucalyptus grandis]
MVKHNNVVPNGHFRKHWQNYVETWFNQPARKARRRLGLHANVQRLKTYKAKLVVFPRRARKFKAGDSTPEELANATQVQGTYLPIVREKPAVELVEVTDEMKSFNAYAKLRVERLNKRHMGARMKKAADAEKEDK